MFLLRSYLRKHSYLLTAKTTFAVVNSLQFVLAVQELRKSLHVRRNFWCLIMLSTKLMLYVYAVISVLQ